jgi:ATP-dependent Clp protease ATP-binding subunit ClpA
VIAQLPFTRVVLEPDKKSATVREFEAMLRARIVGQDEAGLATRERVPNVLAGMTLPDAPIANLLFRAYWVGEDPNRRSRSGDPVWQIVGPGQSRLRRVSAQPRDCEADRSPPGYLGHRETPPVLTQEALDQFHQRRVKLTFVLLDEIEKASDALWQLLLGILDKGTLTLGNNNRVNFSRTSWS